MDQIEPYSPLANDIIILFAMMGSQQAAWQVEKGWAEEGDRLRQKVADREEHKGIGYDHAVEGLQNYYISKLALIDTEVAEAIEEIRNGHAIDERYYSGDENPEWQPGDPLVNPAKPEGVLSELADVIIRIWSLTGETGLAQALGEAIIEKLNYNATRALKHGGKAI